MASKPGILTHWPWKSLGSFKYVILAPWVVHSIYSLIIKDGKERDPVYVLFFPFLLWRTLHNQIWISLSRYRTAKGNNRIVDKSIEFKQVDRESNWSVRNSLSHITACMNIHIFLTDGVLLTILLHMGPVEFLNYWLHRALHHHYLYSRYHSHHHSSVVAEPITSVIHPFAEHLAYFLLFSIPLLAGVFMGKSSIAATFGYISYIDFMNNMGHCNFELIPKMLFSISPLLSTLCIPPRKYHSLHHTQFRTNYSYGTMDKSSDVLYEKSLITPEELPHVVHFTHLVTPQSIYHLRLGFASLASKPYTSKWYVWTIIYIKKSIKSRIENLINVMEGFEPRTLHLFIILLTYTYYITLKLLYIIKIIICGIPKINFLILIYIQIHIKNYRNYYGHKFQNHMSFESPKGTHCLNPMRYHGAYIENTCRYQSPSMVTQSIGIYNHFRHHIFKIVHCKGIGYCLNAISLHRCPRTLILRRTTLSLKSNKPFLEFCIMYLTKCSSM
ncbi:hypothetical protein PVL29_019652 [Vitis rotundifolia]|uniref:Fatty acid hydroxylase domain-containing protein n=1 Tax=Vitis rotundifolia TaxID=103349 RepID=A0AA38Z107_VITRO|nr:hypothetical protein PVL29_019652 [Vitis rotundifolia]